MLLVFLFYLFTFQVTGSIAVRVLERTGVDLIHDVRLPPWLWIDGFLLAQSLVC